MKCKQCHENVEEYDTFCINCGNKIKEDEDTTPEDKEHTKTMATMGGILSIIFGLVSIITCGSIIYSLTTGISGLCILKKVKKKGALCIIGMVVSIIGIFLTSLLYTVAIIDVFILDKDEVTYTYEKDGYTLKYDKNWINTTVDGQDVLKYKDEESYLIPIEVQDFMEEGYKQFDETERIKIYDDYELYLNNLDNNTEIYNGSKDFTLLKDNIYYATYDYKTTPKGPKGKYFLLVSKNENIIVIFMSKSNNYKENDKRSLEIIKTFTKIYGTGIYTK